MWGYFGHYYANFNSIKTHSTLFQRHEMLYNSLRKSKTKYCPCLKWNRDLLYLDCVVLNTQSGKTVKIDHLQRK